MTDDLQKRPAATILRHIATALIVGLGGTAWTSRNERAGFVCASVLLVGAMPFARLVAREFTAFDPYVNWSRLAIVVIFFGYLMLFYDATWTVLAAATGYAAAPVSMGFAILAFLIGFATGAVLLNGTVRNGLARFVRPVVAGVVRTVAQRLHKFAATVDQPTEPEQLVALLNSTERISQVGPPSLHGS